MILFSATYSLEEEKDELFYHLFQECPIFNIRPGRNKNNFFWRADSLLCLVALAKNTGDQYHQLYQKKRFQKMKMKYSEDLEKSSNRPIPVFSICKKQKHRQGKRRLKLLLEKVRAKALAMHKSEEILASGRYVLYEMNYWL